VLTNTPVIIIDNDATGAFDRVIYGFSLTALRSLVFSVMVTRMLGLTWRKRKCCIKTGFGICERYYESYISNQSFGLGQGSTAASHIWCIIHGVLMHTLASSFIGFAIFSVSSKILHGFTIFSVSSKILHKRIGEVIIDDTILVVSAQSSTEITST
jgi:hypothetical protein